jgi:hypothetical protein
MATVIHHDDTDGLNPRDRDGRAGNIWSRSACDFKLLGISLA